MKKLLVLLFSIFFLSSPSVFAETYVCSEELSRFGKTGEIETRLIERLETSSSEIIGADFIQYTDKDEGQLPLEIISESDSDLILMNLSFHLNIPYMQIIIINKETKEFGDAFLWMEGFKNDDPSPFTYGKCVVVN